MERPIASYTFLPWLRQGLSNLIATDDGDEDVQGRASVGVDVVLRVTDLGGATSDTPVPTRTVQLIGPGDIVGIDRKAIVKTEPRDRITNFEPNNLAHIEFYDEDYAWRYTPSAPGEHHRLKPWMTLVLLQEGEFTDGPRDRERPLPYITCDGAFDLFPPADQLWAWAHVHVNRHIAPGAGDVVSDNGAIIAANLQATLTENADLAYSRIVCPRKLEPNTGYHAFLVPSFEAGRVAGLKGDVSKVPFATHSAWADYPSTATDPRPDPTHYPYYHRWYFRTGDQGDFEYLVRLLKPQPMDPRVGQRDMDVRAPLEIVRGLTRPELNGVLKLGGALRIPEDSISEEEKPTYELYRDWATPYPQPIQEDIAEFINLGETYTVQPTGDANDATAIVAGDPDPWVLPPLYARWHARQDRLLSARTGAPLENRSNWVHELNLDPRFRVPAGMGTDVVRAQQETYMDAAWKQVGDILKAERQARLHKGAKAVSTAVWNRDLRPLLAVSPDRALLVAAPVLQRVVPERVTVKALVRDSPIASAALCAPMRRAMRTGARAERMLAPSMPDGVRVNEMARRLDSGSLLAAPVKVMPEAVPSVEDVAGAITSAAVPSWIPPAFLRDPMALWWPFIIALIIAIVLFFLLPVAAFAVAGAAVGGACLAVSRWIKGLRDRSLAIDSVLPEARTPASVDALPGVANFTITAPGSTAPAIAAGTDSTEAARFKTALKESYASVIAARRASPKIVRQPLNVAITMEHTMALLNPARTVAARYQKIVRLPAHIRDGMVDPSDEPMAYPRIDVPMYKPLADISSDNFLPNVGFVPQNSISLLETNQKFIESYMVGINHEMSRELLWREYPTDQRGTYFRQFWDVSAYKPEAGADPDSTRESLYDIPKIHTWRKTTALGEHDNREATGTAEDEAVLVIRGELLKRYPTAVIYAHKADWERKADGVTIDRSKPRKPVQPPAPIAGEDPSDIPRTILKTPLYGAQIQPDIWFFGFDLTILEAKGGTGADNAHDAGWFFVIKERPGEPRFGLDVDRTEDLVTWNDLSWDDMKVEGGSLRIQANMPVMELIAPSATPVVEPQAELEQHMEDFNVKWNANTNAADVAYVLYQVPVLVAVHASEMLPDV
ncbi:MAG: hypothetical protein ABI432_02590 [Flavobacteriales bacterium]